MEQDFGLILVEDKDEEEQQEKWLLDVDPVDVDLPPLDDFLNPTDDLPVRKSSLVEKLDNLKRGSPKHFSTPDVHFGGASTSSPLANYLRRSRLSSTPTNSADKRSLFDGRTFTRGARRQAQEFLPSPVKMETTRPSAANLNATFSKITLDETYSALPDPSTGLNETFVKDDYSTCPPGLNQIPPGLNQFSPAGLNATFEVNHLEDDRLSNAESEESTHRLNNVGDVQHVAKMQEESLGHNVPQRPNRSALSPSSEKSSDLSPVIYQSEESDLSSANMNNNHHNNANRYSSQDSLPDSPYSSQSLDSQPMQNQDRIGRSMPNLNKRGSRPATSGSTQPEKPPTMRKPSAGSNSYGLSRYNMTKKTSSDPRLTQQNNGRSAQQQVRRKEPMLPPSDSVSSRVPTSSRPSLIRPPTASRIARPPTASSIPRPGSRLPMFQPRGRPQPSYRAQQNKDWMEDQCY